MADELEAPPSFNRQIATLDVGDTVAVCRRLIRSDPQAGDIGAVKTKMRNSVNPAVSKARKRTEREFVTDTGEFLTNSGHVMVAVTVTRVS